LSPFIKKIFEIIFYLLLGCLYCFLEITKDPNRSFSFLEIINSNFSLFLYKTNRHIKLLLHSFNMSFTKESLSDNPKNVAYIYSLKRDAICCAGCPHCHAVGKITITSENESYKHSLKSQKVIVLNPFNINVHLRKIS